MNSIYWYDYETTGVSPSLDRPTQFAGLRTDEDLNIVGEPLTLYCQPSREILPHPEACLITGLSPQELEAKGIPEPEFIAAVHREFMVPATCVAGYNSLRFDDEVTRYTLYRNFFDPYEREWQGGNSRWDIIDMLRLTQALRPEGIHWPQGDDGYPSFRLELLTAANGIGHDNAHDALADVYATIAMAKLVKENQPKLYDFIYRNRLKQRVAEQIDLSGRSPFLHVSSRLPRENAYTALMIPLCAHPTNKNAIVGFNLSDDPEPLLRLNSEEIRERVFTAKNDLPEDKPRIALKVVHLNRCPVVATHKLLDAVAAERLGIDLVRCEDHWQRLRHVDLQGKLAEVFSGGFASQSSDAETALYEGFIPSADKKLLTRVRNSDPRELAVLQTRFTDSRYRELVFRYRARYHSEELSEEERRQWAEQRRHMLAEPLAGRLTLEAYYSVLEELEGDPLQGQKERHIVAALRDWGNTIARISAADGE